MIWLAALALAALALAPLGILTWRGGRVRGRQEAAMALHRAQLTELDRDLAEGRLLTAEHEAAKLEVQRRLLTDAALPDGAESGRGTGVVLATVLIVPVAAAALYLTSGHPNFPPPDTAPALQPASTAAPDPATIAKDEALIAQLRSRLTLMNPHAPATIRGYQVLGNAELAMGHLPEAAEAWRHVLEDHFDPTLAVQTAEVLTEIAGDHTTPESLALFKRALAEAPPDAPWRPMAEKRIAEGGR